MVKEEKYAENSAQAIISIKLLTEMQEGETLILEDANTTDKDRKRIKITKLGGDLFKIAGPTSLFGKNTSKDTFPPMVNSKDILEALANCELIQYHTYDTKAGTKSFKLTQIKPSTLGRLLRTLVNLFFPTKLDASTSNRITGLAYKSQDSKSDPSPPLPASSLTTETTRYVTFKEIQSGQADNKTAEAKKEEEQHHSPPH